MSEEILPALSQLASRVFVPRFLFTPKQAFVASRASSVAANRSRAHRPNRMWDSRHLLQTQARGREAQHCHVAARFRRSPVAYGATEAAIDNSVHAAGTFTSMALSQANALTSLARPFAGTFRPWIEKGQWMTAMANPKRLTMHTSLQSTPAAASDVSNAQLGLCRLLTDLALHSSPLLCTTCT